MGAQTGSPGVTNPTPMADGAKPAPRIASGHAVPAWQGSGQTLPPRTVRETRDPPCGALVEAPPPTALGEAGPWRGQVNPTRNG